MLARLVVVLCKYRLLVYSGLTHKCCRRICGPRHVVEIVHNVSLCRSLLLYYYYYYSSLVLPCCRYLFFSFYISPPPRPWRPNNSSTKT